jgi:hypothetical protein
MATKRGYARVFRCQSLKISVSADEFEQVQSRRAGLEDNDDTVVLSLPQGGYTHEADLEEGSGPVIASATDEEREPLRARPPRPVCGRHHVLCPDSQQLCMYSHHGISVSQNLLS